MAACMQVELEVARQMVSRLAKEAEQAAGEGRREGEERACQAMSRARQGAALEQRQLADELQTERAEVWFV